MKNRMSAGMALALAVVFAESADAQLRFDKSVAGPRIDPNIGECIASCYGEEIREGWGPYNIVCTVYYSNTYRSGVARTDWWGVPDLSNQTVTQTVIVGNDARFGFCSPFGGWTCETAILYNATPPATLRYPSIARNIRLSLQDGATYRCR